MNQLALIAIVFAGVVGEAAIVWWLSAIIHAGHVQFLQDELKEARKTITGLVDRIQSPATADLVKRQKALAEVEQAAKLTPEQHAKIRIDAIVENVLQEESWRQLPAFDGVIAIHQMKEDPNKFQVISGEDPDTGMPVIEELSRMELAAAFTR